MTFNYWISISVLLLIIGCATIQKCPTISPVCADKFTDPCVGNIQYNQHAAFQNPDNTIDYVLQDRCYKKCSTWGLNDRHVNLDVWESTP